MSQAGQTEVSEGSEHIKSFHFFEAKDDADESDKLFYAQCEWFDIPLELNDDNAENVEYCFLTVTDLDKYWQIRIDRDLLRKQFKVRNALTDEIRNDLLQQTLQGAEQYNEKPIGWYVILQEDEIKLKLKYHLIEGLPMVLGSLVIEQVGDDRKGTLQQSWFKNSAYASRASARNEEALCARIKNLEATYAKMQQNVDTMRRESLEFKMTCYTDVAKVINKKKDKIIALKTELKETNHKLKETNEELKECRKRRREHDDEDGDDSQQQDKKGKGKAPATKVRKVTKNEVEVKAELTPEPSTSKRKPKYREGSEAIGLSLMEEYGYIDEPRSQATQPIINNNDDESSGTESYHSESSEEDLHELIGSTLPF